MLPLTPEHEKQLASLRGLISKAGLDAYRVEIEKLVRPAIGLKTRKARRADLAPGATRIGGEPDLPADFEWPSGEGEPVLFVAQIRLADVTALDLEQRLPKSGLLSFFSDPYVDDVFAYHFPEGSALEKREWPHEEYEPFNACGLEVRPELHIPPPSTTFVGLDAPAARPGSAKRLGSLLVLPEEAYSKYWDDLHLAWLETLRPAWKPNQGSIHQMLGYSCGDDADQGHEDEVLFSFDSDDVVGMEWGDAQRIFLLIDRPSLARLDFSNIRATT